MSIREKNIPGGWQVDFTGDDIHKSRGMLRQHGNEKYREAFHKNEGIGFERVTDPSGNVTHVRADQVADALVQGYGRVGSRPSMIVPDLPWLRKPVGPGRHRFRYDRSTGTLVEVS